MSEPRATITSGPPMERRTGRPRVMLRMVIMLACVGVLFFLVFGFGVFRNIMIGRFLATLSNPPQTVAVVQAETSLWQSTPSISNPARTCKAASCC
jgi:membrane fusion protein (multidrug efflux system)